MDTISPLRAAQPSRRVFRLVLGCIVAAAVLLRLWDLGTPQLWEDDYLNLDRAMLDPARLVEVQLYQGPADTVFDFQPPLSYLLTHLALGVSQTVLAARMPSLVCGVLSILGLGLLGAACAGRRAGLAAAALCAGALFHVELSRAIKLYAVFFCALVYSLYFLVRVVSPGRRPRHLAGYAAASAAMLWSGYQGVPVMAAQGLGLGLLFFTRQGIFHGNDRTARLGWTAAAMAVPVILWLPIAPGLFFVNAFLKNPGINPWDGLGPDFFASVLAGFFYLNFEPAAVTVPAIGVLLALGLAAAWNGPTLLVVLAGLVPGLAILSSQSDLRPLANWRHLIALLPAVSILCGSGAAGIAGLLCRRLPRAARTPAALLLTAGACSLILAPPLTRLGDFYQRTLTNDRDLFRHLSRAPGPEASLAFTGYQRNAKAFAARWHLPEQAAPPGAFAAPGYGRVRIVDLFWGDSPRRRAKPHGALQASWGAGGLNTRIALAGLPSRAPLLLAPDASGRAGYADDFRDWRAYRDAFALDNCTVDSEVGLLRPTRFENPATAVWRFDLPPASPPATVRARITAALYKRHPTRPADSVLTVSASADGRTYSPVASLGHADFLDDQGNPRLQPRQTIEELPFYSGRCREASVEIDLTPFVAGGTVLLRVTNTPGRQEGYLTLAGLEVTAAGLATTPPVDPLAFYAANLARNCRAPAYRPGTALLGPAAYVFAAPAHPELARVLPGGEVIGTPQSLAAFEAAHPGLAAAYSLPDAAGTAAVVVHDPALAPDGGGVALSDTSPRVRLDRPGRTPEPVRSLTLAGRINAPVLTLEGTRIPVPVSAPPGSVLRLTPGGSGVLTFSPDFDPPDFTDGANARFQNMAAATSYPDYAGGVTCQPHTDCRFEYVFVSAFPMTELRIMAYPRLYGDAGGQGACRVAYAAGERDFETVLDVRNDRDGQWSPLFTRRFVRVALPRPTTRVTVRFTLLANATAEFWSPVRPVDRMVIEAGLDARSLAPFTVPAGLSELALGGEPGNALRVWFGSQPPGLERVWPGQ
ncbi:glycosyltransferase family 39 protein [Solidesulfovibrio sp.]